MTYLRSLSSPGDKIDYVGLNPLEDIYNELDDEEPLNRLRIQYSENEINDGGEGMCFDDDEYPFDLDEEELF
jgi:hypothetical protein